MSEYKTDSTTKKDGRWYKSSTPKRDQRRWQTSLPSKQHSHRKRLGTLTSQHERQLKRLRAVIFERSIPPTHSPKTQTIQTKAQNNQDPFFDPIAIAPIKSPQRRKLRRTTPYLRKIWQCGKGLIALIEHYPSFLWGSIWILLFCMGILAFFALSNPLYTTTPITPPKPPEIIKTNGELPLWFFGAIALSCAAGCWGISRWLNREDSPE